MAVPAGVPPRSPLGYVTAVAITVFAVLSQYFVPEAWAPARAVYYNLPGDFAVVYGIPIVAFAVLVGARPLARWRANSGTATWEGLRWYGALSLLALFVFLALYLIYEAVDPSALGLLNTPNPELTAAASDPWFYVGLSFAVGAVEETIFRGWIFGYWVGAGRGWVGPAAWTSALFAGVHLYYGTTYGVVSPLIFPTLFLAGFAFAATYRYSRGNLLVPALLHGQFDATSYLSLVSLPVSLALHYGVILLGGLVALIAYLRTPPPATPAAGGGAPTG